jgi:hypothetical protein
VLIGTLGLGLSVVVLRLLLRSRANPVKNLAELESG